MAQECKIKTIEKFSKSIEMQTISKVECAILL